MEASCLPAEEHDTDPSKHLYVLCVVSRSLQIIVDLRQLRYNLPVHAMTIEISWNGAHHLRPSIREVAHAIVEDKWGLVMWTMYMDPGPEVLDNMS